MTYDLWRSTCYLSSRDRWSPVIFAYMHSSSAHVLKLTVLLFCTNYWFDEMASCFTHSTECAAGSITGGRCICGQYMRSLPSQHREAINVSDNSGKYIQQRLDNYHADLTTSLNQLHDVQRYSDVKHEANSRFSCPRCQWFLIPWHLLSSDNICLLLLYCHASLSDEKGDMRQNLTLCI